MYQGADRAAYARVGEISCQMRHYNFLTKSVTCSFIRDFTKVLQKYSNKKYYKRAVNPPHMFCMYIAVSRDSL